MPVKGIPASLYYNSKKSTAEMDTNLGWVCHGVCLVQDDNLVRWTGLTAVINNLQKEVSEIAKNKC